MRKPVNKFAFAPLVLAGLVLIGECFDILALWQNMRSLSQEAGETYVVIGSLVTSARNGVLAAVQLASFAVIIELIDQIRWNGLQRGKP